MHWVSSESLALALALCLLAFLWSSGRGGMGYGYLLLDAIDPVDEVGDLAGDSVLRRRGGRCACYNVKRRRAALWRGLSGVWLAKDTEGHVRRIDPGAHVESVTLGNALLESLEQWGVVGHRRGWSWKLELKAHYVIWFRWNNGRCRKLGFYRQPLHTTLSPAQSRTHPSSGVGIATVSSHTPPCQSGAVSVPLVWRASAAQQNGIVRIEVSGAREYDEVTGTADWLELGGNNRLRSRSGFLPHRAPPNEEQLIHYYHEVIWFISISAKERKGFPFK